jgi:phosphatidylglycerophosphatase A
MITSGAEPAGHPRASLRFVWTHPAHALAFGLGTGLSRVAPGTLGTVAAIPVYLVLRGGEAGLYWGLTAVFFALGVWACGHTARALGAHDHPGIVWDEIVGYLITMGFAPIGWEWVMAGFVVFRFFDIIKPWPIKSVDQRLGGGIGIMLDDALAALYSIAALWGLMKWVS